MKKSRLSALILSGVFLLFSVWCWIGAPVAFSDSERRPLAQRPALNAETVWDGSFSADFEDFATDQFPLRDSFRTLKALAQSGLFLQKDNNGIAVSGGSAFALTYPLNEDSVRAAGEKFAAIYQTYVAGTGDSVYLAFAPDKAYYLAQAGGYPALDYEALLTVLRAQMPFASYIDLTNTLSADNYYKTDTHWRQETLLPTAQALAAGLGVTLHEDSYTALTSPQPFYGVYYGQAALPMAPDTLYYLTSPTLDGCSVYHAETGETTTVYDLEKFTSRDPYEVFLSGASAVVRLTNPNAAENRRLIVFRDSFASSLIPLLAEAYSEVVLVDTRYIATDLVGEYVGFNNADVLFLYSTLLLNSSAVLK